MNILPRPIFPPNVCNVCRTQAVGIYVDPEIQLDNDFNPLYSGAIVFCLECWDNLFTTAARLIQEYNVGNTRLPGPDAGLSDSSPTEPDSATADSIGDDNESSPTDEPSTSDSREFSLFRFGG